MKLRCWNSLTRICMYNNYTLQNKCALVEWVDEVSFLIVPCLKISEGVFSVGKVGKVKLSQGHYDAVVAVGKCVQYIC